jgi:hypothetical protein
MIGGGAPGAQRYAGGVTATAPDDVTPVGVFVLRPRWLRWLPENRRGKEFADAAFEASLGMPGRPAALLLGFALIHALLVGRLPVLTCVAAFAGAASLEAALRRNAVVRRPGGPPAALPDGTLPPIAVASLARGERFRYALGAIFHIGAITGFIAAVTLGLGYHWIAFATTVLCVAAGRGHALSLPLRLRPPDEPGRRFCVVAQQQPWRATATVLAVAVAEVALDATGVTDVRPFSPAHVLVALGALVTAVHLVARSPNGSGRLAPLVFGIPIGGIAVTFAIAAAFWPFDLSWAVTRVASREDLLIAGLGLAGWALLAAYLFAYSLGPGNRVRVGVAAALAAGWTVALWPILPRAEVAALVAWSFALPVLIAAAAEMSCRATRTVLLGALTGAVLAASVRGVAPQPLAVEEVTARHVVLDNRAWFIVHDLQPIPHVLTEAFAGAALGALVAGAGALCRRARSLTAIPRDHPVFTEGPYVRARRAESAGGAG